MDVDRITVAVVARARPRASADLWVTERSLSEFKLRVYPSGRKSYVLIYRRGGARQKHVIGEHGAPWRPDPETGAARVLTPELAREEAIRLLGGMVEGKDPATTRAAVGRMPTLAEFEKTYFRDHATPHKAPRAADGDRSNLRVHLVPALGRIRFDKITAGDVARLHASMSSTPVTANRCLSLLSHMFTKARQWGILPPGHANPCADVERFEEPRRERFLQPDELRRVGLALLGQLPMIGLRRECPPAVAALQLVMLTGARPGEILAVRRELLGPRVVLARSKTSKRTKRPRIIVFNPFALAIAEALPAVPGNPYLIPGAKRGAHLTISGLEDIWDRVGAAAGVEDVRLMDLRHTFASVGVGAGETLRMIQELLGHTNPATTMRYAHLGGDPLSAGSERVAGIIAEALNRKG